LHLLVNSKYITYSRLFVNNEEPPPGVGGSSFCYPKNIKPFGGFRVAAAAGSPGIRQRLPRWGIFAANLSRGEWLKYPQKIKRLYFA
jgi:hypothetical protein